MLSLGQEDATLLESAFTGHRSLMLLTTDYAPTPLP
jgi:hypothetical protein